MRPRTRLDRTAVVTAAAALLDEAGPDGLTLKALAERLDVKPPSLFNHISGGLPDLRRELTLLALRESYALFARATVGKAADDAVRALANAYRAFARQRPGLYAATIWPTKADDTELQKVAQELIGLIADVLAAYGLQGDDAIHAVRGLRSIAHGFVSLEMAGSFQIALDRDESYRRLIDSYIIYLRDQRGLAQMGPVTRPATQAPS
jgi:AcrR family transcriptional regulator